MDAFLAQAQSEGVQDSRGVFTINAEKAEIKLAKFQIATLEHFPRFLLAAATAGGASGLRIRWKSGKTAIEIYGWTISQADLQAIGMHSLKRETRRELRYLATVLSALGSRHRFSLVTEDFQVQFEHGLLQFPARPLIEVDPGSMTLEIETQLKDEVERGLSGQQKFCPFNIQVGATELQRGYDPSIETLDSFAFVTRTGDRLPEVTLKYARPQTHLKLASDDEAPPLALGLAPPGEAERSGIWLLVDELACRAPYDFAPFGFYGVVIAPELTLDLSYDLNKNEPYYALQARLTEACRKLCLDLRDRFGSLPTNQQKILRRASEKLGLSWQAGGVRTQAPAEVATDVLAPVVSTGLVRALVKRLPELDQVRKELLHSRYRDRVLRELRQGNVGDALAWQRARTEVSRATGASTPQELVVPHLLELVSGFQGTPEQKLAELAAAGGAELATYLRALRDWEVKPGTDISGIHPSWLVPLGVVLDHREPWMLLLELLEQGDAATALRLVRGQEPLLYSGYERSWLRYFWEHSQGTMPWTELVKLRVALSFASDDGTRDYSTVPFDKFRQDVILTESTRPPFWPHFLSLLRHAERLHGEDARSCWTPVLARLLLERCLTDSEPALASPLFS